MGIGKKNHRRTLQQQKHRLPYMEFIIIYYLLTKSTNRRKEKQMLSHCLFDTRKPHAYWMNNFSIYILRLEIKMMIRYDDVALIIICKNIYLFICGVWVAHI